MLNWVAGGKELAITLGWLLIHPLYYIGLLLIYLQYRKQIFLQRKLFYVKLHSIGGALWQTFIWGWVAGVVASLLMLVTGAFLRFETMIWLWVIALVLFLFRPRFVCFAYAVAIVGLLHGLLKLFPQWIELEGFSALHPLLQPLIDLHFPSLLVLVAVLHAIEAFLINKWSGRYAIPLFMKGKRGKVVGGFQMQGFWPVPLFLLMPASTGGFAIEGSWIPLLLHSSSVSGSYSGWTMMALPVIIGFSEWTQTTFPAEKAKRTSRRLLIYAALVLLLAFASEWVPVIIVFASLLTILMHEAILWFSRREERIHPPQFVQDGDGLKVLAVIPGSPADQLGIRSGEVIRSVNGIKVNTKEALHSALRENAAFCKLEVINLDGETKFLSKSIYDGDHHQLGILLAPDDDANYYVERRERPVWANWIRPFQKQAVEPTVASADLTDQRS